MNLRRKLLPCHEPLPDNEKELKEILARLQIPVQGLNQIALAANPLPPGESIRRGEIMFDRVEAQRRIREVRASHRAWRLAALAALASMLSALAAWYAVLTHPGK
jgi:hypothetical protein